LVKFQFACFFSGFTPAHGFNVGGEEVDKYLVEYASEPFVNEIQKVSIDCASESETQVVTTSASVTKEVQLVHARLADELIGWDGVAVDEVQRITCDASGGTFTLAYRTHTTGAIPYDAVPADVEAALLALTPIRGVTVTHEDGAAAPACTAANAPPYLQIEFTDVDGAAGDVDTLVAGRNALSGARRVVVSEHVRGQAGLEGTFALSFRGFTTAPIDVATASASDVEDALNAIDPIPFSGGVVVTTDSDLAPTTSFEKLWRVTFDAPEVGGDVEALVVFGRDMLLTGNGAAVAVYADGDAPPASRSGITASVQGNQLGGTFTLNLRGHTTEPIEYVERTLLLLLLLLLRPRATAAAAAATPTRYCYCYYYFYDTHRVPPLLLLLPLLYSCTSATTN
jgi:hypothetical protein